MIGYDPSTSTPSSQEAVMTAFANSWFSSARSTEAMMRGTTNETPVLRVLRSKQFIIEIYECGMIANKAHSWMACTPDALSWIDTSKIDTTDRGFQCTDVIQLACIEIKTSVASSSLDRTISRSSLCNGHMLLLLVT